MLRRFNRNQKADAVLMLYKLLLVFCYIGVYSFVWYRCYGPRLYVESFFAKGDYVVIGLFAVLYLMFARLYDGFSLAISSPGELTYAHVVTSVITVSFMYVITWLLIRYMPAVLPSLGLLGALILLAFVWSFFGCRLADRLLPPRKIVIVYGHPDALLDGREILTSTPRRFSLAGEVDADAPQLFEVIRSYSPKGIMLCGVNSTRRNDLIKFCHASGLDAYVRPSIGDILMQGAETMRIDNLPVMHLSQGGPSVWYLMVKRAMDILLGLLAMLVFSPFMLVTAIAIKAYDGGPVFYKQVRLTKNRREFYVYKFRSMRVDAEKDGVARLASQGDDRITPVGKIIRALRIDEMPQLLCILLGTMTIVGPRPERPEIAADYEKTMPEFALRLQAKAGLTGLAQVYGKYNTTPYNKLQMDLEYIGSMSLITDMKIILATIKILFMPESTEGVAQGQTTAKKDDTANQEEAE